MHLNYISTCLLFIFLCNLTSAQNPAKKKMDPSVYDEWKSIEKVQISNDGNWISYELNTEGQDKHLILHDQKNTLDVKFPRSSNAKITSDNAFVVFQTSPSIDSLKEMRRRKIDNANLPKDTLCIFNLKNKTLQKISGLKNFEVPMDWSGYLVYQLQSDSSPPAATVGIDSSSQDITLKWDENESDENGYKLYVRNLQNQRLDSFAYIQNYKLAKKNASITFTSSGMDSLLAKGVYKYDCIEKKLRPLFRSSGKVKKITIADNGGQGAFIINRDTNDLQIAPFELAYWDANDTAKIIVNSIRNKIKDDWYINEFYNISFSENQKSLFFGINPKPILQDSSLLPEEIVNVEVWSYLDKRLHTQQKVNLKKDKEKAFIVRYNIGTGSFTQITDDQKITDLILSRNKNEESILCFASDHYLESTSWEGFPTYKDVYLNKGNDNHILLEKKIKASPKISPQGKYIYYYNYPDSKWYSINTKTEEKIDLTLRINTSLANELHDSPSMANSYGIAGWTDDDESLLIYDRYDIWEVNPRSVQSTKKLTNGRSSKISYRYIDLRKDQDYIDKSTPMFLKIYDDLKGEGGIANYDWSKSKLSEKMRSKHNYRLLLKAKSADRFLLRRENFQDFPDIELCDASLNEPTKISLANPQQDDYSWGTIEWYYWTAPDGQKLRGLLVRPDNFDSNKSYPLLVNFYEKSSSGINYHRAPHPHRSTINYSYYANQGYVIFNPDVHYKDGYPGESAYNSVISGVESLITEGYIDVNRIGAQGHSWGGYQVAHLITKTDLFACVESGAPVVNMTSAYGGIRWRSGLSRMFQYEKNQSRIGATLWESPELYIKNSPLFSIDKINTPVLILHNDKDGAVPWYQGIEFFVALRRLNKPAWMLNYNEEPHWPVKRQNRIDFNIRMQQFFDYYLMDKPMPRWMDEGVSAKNKGINQALELLPK